MSQFHMQSQYNRLCVIAFPHTKNRKTIMSIKALPYRGIRLGASQYRKLKTLRGEDFSAVE